MGQVLRAAGRQDAHDVKVGEGGDQAEQHRDRDDIPHHRQGHEEQFLHRVRAIDRRRFVEIEIYPLETGVKEDHIEAQSLPD